MEKKKTGPVGGVRGALKKNKTAGIIVSILLVIIGILIFCFPIRSGIVFAYLAVAGFIVYGVFDIIRYKNAPADAKNGWMLATGILSIVFGVLIIVEALGMRFGTLNLVSTIGFCIGFYAMMTGINQVCMSGAVKAAGGSAGWAIASGIINIILSVVVLGSPVLGFFAADIILGVYMVVFGIALFAECCSAK